MTGQQNGPRLCESMTLQRGRVHVFKRHSEAALCVQLVKKGANLDHCSNSSSTGGTPLHIATAHGAKNAAFMLLHYGASPFRLNHYGVL